MPKAYILPSMAIYALGSSPKTYLMDQNHTKVSACPRAVFSTSRVIAEYRGPLFRVSSMTAERDIMEGFDTSMPMISVWYDQSGCGRHAIQPVHARRPMLLSNLVDFKNNRFLMLPDKTIPAGDEPFTIMFKHWDIMNPVGGVIGSGEYNAHNAVNAIRRNGNNYVNYFWGNDMQTEANSFREGNVVTFAIKTKDHRTQHSAFVNGILNATRQDVIGRYSSPINTTIGKTYSENEYLNGSLEFLYVLDEFTEHRDVALDSGAWS